jgi:hypothetical protein
MRRSLVAVLVAASFTWLPWFNRGAAQEVTGDTRILANATYVAIGFGAGGVGFVSDAEAGKSLDVSQEDRTALVAIRKQFETWNRYVLTTFPKSAELLITVRTGRRGAVSGRTAVGGPASGTGLNGIGAGASSPDDMLCVYTSVGGKARAMVWQRALPNGLSGTPAPLFEEFRSAVEAAAKKHRPALSGIAPAAALAPVESTR